MYDVIVVGGGIVGMSTAYHLVCTGAKTLLIDREDQGRATDAGAGILSPETNSRDPDAWFDFAVAGRPRTEFPGTVTLVMTPKPAGALR